LHYYIKKIIEIAASKSSDENHINYLITLASCKLFILETELGYLFTEKLITLR
jgi:hypothetical protein